MWKMWLIRGVIGIALVGVGAGATFVLMKRKDAHAIVSRAQPSETSTAEHFPPGPPGPPGPLPDFDFSLNETALERAGLDTAMVTTKPVTTEVRVPGVVEPNAYRTVVVTPLVNGRIVSVPVGLGDRVRSGQTLATVFSPDLADAQTQYLSKKADFDYDHEVLQRTERLAEIGAASRQELEEVRAVHTRHETEVESARSRLLLLGLSPEDVEKLTSPKQVSAAAVVPAPVSGVVIRRLANPGLVVETSSELFTVADLSTVWIIGSLYERDFGAVSLGSPATLSTPAYPGIEIRGRVRYIDPQVKEETRTAQVRVEVPNEGGRLRLGMYVDLRIEGAQSHPVVVVPREAIQLLGDRSVVYLVSGAEKGRFTERDVTVGRRSGEEIEVVEGLKPGDRVVTKGSFSVRAERERSYPTRSSTTAPAPMSHIH